MNFRMSKSQLFGFNDKMCQIWTIGGHYFTGKLHFDSNLPDYVVMIDDILLNTDDVVACSKMV